MAKLIMEYTFQMPSVAELKRVGREGAHLITEGSLEYRASEVPFVHIEKVEE